MKNHNLLDGDFSEFKNALLEAEIDPKKFFSDAKNFRPDKLPKLLSVFLNLSENYEVLKETILAINKFKRKENLEDLIDFLMNDKFNNREKFDIINLKTLSIRAISNYKDKKGIPALLYCLNDKSANYKMRFMAAEALGTIGDENAVESLISVVSDEDEKSVYVRESAATALGMIGDMRAVDTFLSILETKKGILGKFSFLKERVIEALIKMDISGSERAINAMIKALDDESPQVRINAIECIMNSKDKNASKIIKTKLDDKDNEVIKNAVIALYNLDGKDILLEIINDDKFNKIAKEEAEGLYREYEE